MGLDMNLYAETYLDGFDNAGPQQQAAFRKVLDIVGLARYTPADSIPFVAVRLHVANWKNAYHIDKWFVDQAQGGDGRCRETEVETDDLHSLLALCKRLLAKKDRKEAMKALPPPPGLFERYTDDEDYFWKDAYWWHLEATVIQLSAVLSNPRFQDWRFFYHRG